MKTTLLIFAALFCMALLTFAAYAGLALTAAFYTEWQEMGRSIERLEQEQRLFRGVQDEFRQTQDTILQGQQRILDIFDGAEVGEYEVSAYSPLCPDAVYGMDYIGDPMVTASGDPPVPGKTVAAGPGVPFGSRVWLESVGWRTVNDRGSRIHDRAVDLVFPTKAAADDFGRQWLKGVVVP